MESAALRKSLWAWPTSVPIALALACSVGVDEGPALTFNPIGGDDAADTDRSEGDDGDDDDDGQTSVADGGDDGLPTGACNAGASQPCYDGAPGTDGVGACAAGTSTCNDGMWGPCTGAVLPGTETCNGIDDDCDGQVDNALADAGAPCQTGMPGVCADGTTACVNGVPTCNTNTVPAAEMCDGADNDCNGQVDDGNPGGGGSCNTGMSGVCANGTQNCQAGSLVCTQTQNPQAEICGNNLDDDCNGAVDDGCQVGGCVGYCGGSSPEGCWCDGACVGLGDCCSNACAVCGQC